MNGAKNGGSVAYSSGKDAKAASYIEDLKK
jgi:hypothetical protein